MNAPKPKEIQRCGQPECEELSTDCPFVCKKCAAKENICRKCVPPVKGDFKCKRGFRRCGSGANCYNKSKCVVCGKSYPERFVCERAVRVARAAEAENPVGETTGRQIEQNVDVARTRSATTTTGLTWSACDDHMRRLKKMIEDVFERSSYLGRGSNCIPPAEKCVIEERYSKLQAEMSLYFYLLKKNRYEMDADSVQNQINRYQTEYICLEAKRRYLLKTYKSNGFLMWFISIMRCCF